MQRAPSHAAFWIQQWMQTAMEPVKRRLSRDEHKLSHWHFAVGGSIYVLVYQTMVGMLKAISLDRILWVVWIDVFFFQRPFPHSIHWFFRRIAYYSYDSDIAAIEISLLVIPCDYPLPACLQVPGKQRDANSLQWHFAQAWAGTGWAPCITPLHIGQRTLAAALLARRAQILVAMPESLAVSFLVV